MDISYPNRKPLRIPNYDYSQNNVYFLTLCTANRMPVFWRKPFDISSGIPLSPIGTIVQTCIEQIPLQYDSITIEKYCIMPDHIHLLLFVGSSANGRPMVAPTVSRVVQQFKGFVTKQVGQPIWQKSFYDHIIRNDADYMACWQYIENNPLKYEVKSCL